MQLYGVLAQLVAHHTGSVGVRGSNPLSSTSRGARHPIRECSRCKHKVFMPDREFVFGCGCSTSRGARHPIRECSRCKHKVFVPDREFVFGCRCSTSRGARHPIRECSRCKHKVFMPDREFVFGCRCSTRKSDKFRQEICRFFNEINPSRDL